MSNLSPGAEQLILEPAELEACCRHLADCHRFGLDTEFVGEDHYHPKLCLVQVATSERLFVIDPFSVGSLDAFWKLVVDPANLVIVHAGREEVRLCHLWSGQTPGNLFDLQIAAGLVGFGYPLGHGPLVNQVLGVRLAKTDTLTEWRDRPLTKSQIAYALDDVRYLLPVWQKLQARLEELERVEWAREEFARLRVQATPEEPGAESDKWRKLRGSGNLDRRRLAIVREVFNWREQAALEVNRPPRTIVRDDLVIEIARRNPTRPRDLHTIRGLAKRYADAIFEAVQRVHNLTPEHYPEPSEREQDPPQVALAVNILSAVLGDFSARNRLAPNLIASTQDLRMLARSHFQRKQLCEDNVLATGWRSRHVLPELEMVLSGRRLVAIVDLHREAPLGYEDRPGAS
jgi:ribonuclease D